MLHQSETKQKDDSFNPPERILSDCIAIDFDETKSNDDGKQGELGFDDGVPFQSDAESEPTELSATKVLRKYYSFPCYREDADCVEAWKALRDDREVVNALDEVVDDLEEKLVAVESDSFLSPTRKKVIVSFYQKVIQGAKDELVTANHKAMESLMKLDGAMRAYDGE